MPRLENLLRLAELLTGSYLRAHSAEEIEQRLKDFIVEYDPVEIPLQAQNQWFKLRRCTESEPHRNLKDLLYHENGSPEIGRAHFPGDRIIYGGDSIKTALDEMGAEKGDVFTGIVFTLDPNISISGRIIGLYQSFWAGRPIEYGGANIVDIYEKQRLMDPALAERNAYIDSVLSDVFHRPYKRPWEYKLTATFAKHLMANGNCLIYPSVENLGGHNIAMLADDFDRGMMVAYSIQIRVTGSFGHSFYSFDNLLHSTKFRENGEITWTANVAEEMKTPWGNWKKV